MDYDWLGQPVYGNVPYESFRDDGAQYTSPQYLAMTPGTQSLTWTCANSLGDYYRSMMPQIDAFIASNLDAPIASLAKIPSNWDGK